MLRLAEPMPVPAFAMAAFPTKATRTTTRWMLGAGHANTVPHVRPSRTTLHMASNAQNAEPARQGHAHVSHSAYGGLLESIYSTVEDPTRWPIVLDQISGLVGADQTFLLGHGTGAQLPPAMASAGTDPDALKLFLDYYASINVFAEPADRIFHPDETRFSHWVVSDADLERTEFYQDFLRRFGVHYSFGLRIQLPQQGSLYLSCQRAKGKTCFSEAEGSLLQGLRPHLQRAFQLQQQSAASQCEIDGLLASINAFGHAVFGLDREGQVVFRTEQAKLLLRDASAFAVRDGRLRCMLPNQTDLIPNMLDALGRISHPKVVSRVVSKVDEQPVQVTAAALSNAPQDAFCATVIYVHDSALQPPARTTLLRDIYRLSPIENRLCHALLCGHSVQSSAEMLRLTQSTCRFHLKTIFTKTGVRRQSELMMMLSSLPAL